MINIEEYPDILSEDLQDIVKFLQRIVEQRDDDVTAFNQLASEAAYDVGFAKKTYEWTADDDIGRYNLYNDGDATGGNITLTLDSSPRDGQTHYFSKIDASGNTVTIDGNGKNINGSATLALSTQYDTMLITYMGNAGEWRRWI